MSINYKIILEYIKDISVEVPDADVLIVTRENITNYFLVRGSSPADGTSACEVLPSPVSA